MTRRLAAAASNPQVDVLGHVTGRLVEGSRGTRPQSTFDARVVFEACAANGVAVEINSRPERQDPPDDLLALALELGCLFSIDSDAHAPGQLSLIDYGARARRARGHPGGAHRDDLAARAAAGVDGPHALTRGGIAGATVSGVTLHACAASSRGTTAEFAALARAHRPPPRRAPR